MLPRLALVLLLALAACVSPALAGQDGPVGIADDTGRDVLLPAPARRIVPLYGAFADVLAEMGLADRVVARTRAEGDGPFADLPSIGTHMRPNVELVLAVRPDLVLQMAGRAEASLPVEQLRKLGIPVAMFDVRSFDDLFSMILRLGELTGAPDRARALVDRMAARLDSVATAVAAEPGPGPTVFFEVRYPNLLAAGRGSMVDDIIRRAGGINAVTADAKLARLGEEELVRLAPQVYLVQRGPMNPDPSNPADRPHFADLPAVRQGRVFEVDESLFSRPGPGCVRAVEELAAILYPHAFPANGAEEESQ